MDAQQKHFQDRFEGIIPKEPVLCDVLKRVEAQGFNRSYVISLVGYATDPSFLKKLRKQWGTIQNDLPFSGKRLSGLAKRTEHLAHDLEWTFRHTLLAPHPKVKRLLDLAASLRAEASHIRRFPKPKLGKVLSYKALHSHIPTALVCAGLRVGNKGASFADVGILLWYANFARGKQPGERADKSIKREYNRFRKSLAGKLFLFSLATNGLPLAHSGRHRRLAAAMA